MFNRASDKPSNNSALLQSTRQKYHIRIRRQKVEKERKIRRLEFIHSHSSHPIPSSVQLQYLYYQISQKSTPQQNRLLALSEITLILSRLTEDKANKIPMTQQFLKYALQRLTQSNTVDSKQQHQYLLEIIILIIYSMEDDDIIALDLQSLINISLVAISTFDFKAQGILLCMNLSFFSNDYITNTLCSQKFLQHILNMIEELPLDTVQKRNILMLYYNLVVDPHSDVKLLVKYFSCINLLLVQNYDMEIAKQGAKVVLSLLKKEFQVSYEREFDEVVKVLIEGAERWEELVGDTVKLLAGVMDSKEKDRMGLYLEEYELGRLLLVFMKKINDEKDHECVISICQQIQSYLEQRPNHQHSQLVFQLMLFYCSSLPSFTSNSLKQSILNLINQSNLIDNLINTNQYLLMLRGIDSQTTSTESQLLMIEILEKSPLDKIQNYCVFLEIVMRLMKSWRKSDSHSVRDKCEEILMYIMEDNQEEDWSESSGI